jgi:sigma-B regulation protein RsbU (phosphoserine phosphatase)
MIALQPLPERNSLPALAGFNLAGFSRSTTKLGGGDCYEVLPAAGGGWMLVIADVMGKGAEAADFAARFRTVMREAAQSIQEPNELLNHANRSLFEELSGADLFITAQIARVELRPGKLTVANAGHCPLLLSGGYGKLRAVAPEGFPLGILPGGGYVQETQSLETSDCVLLYTDGLTEARNAAGEFFGQERLEQWLCLNTSLGLNAVGLRQELRRTLEEFESGIPAGDDQTFVVLAGGRPSHNRAAISPPRFELPSGYGAPGRAAKRP